MKTSDEMIKRYLFDFPGYAKELHSFIYYHYMMKSHKDFDENFLIKALEELILNLVRVVIYENTHKVQPHQAIDDQTAYELYANKVNVDPSKMAMLMMDSILLDNLLDEIYNVVRERPWHFFVVKRGMIEDFGDWRIMQWEKEHLDERGNYVDKKDNS